MPISFASQSRASSRRSVGRRCRRTRSSSSNGPSAPASTRRRSGSTSPWRSLPPWRRKPRRAHRHLHRHPAPGARAFASSRPTLRSSRGTRLGQGRARIHPGRRLDAEPMNACGVRVRARCSMISPPRPDGPPLRDGRPYSAIAKLAERVEAFVAMAQGLAETRLFVAEDSRRGSRGRPSHHRGSRREGVIDVDGPDPRALRAWRPSFSPICIGATLPETLADRSRARAHDPPLRSRGASRRGRSPARLVCAPRAAARPCPLRRAPNSRAIWRSALLPIVTGPRSWYLARFPLAESSLAAGAGGAGEARPHRFPGYGHRPSGL